MNKKYLIVIGGLLAALLVVGVIGATSAYAQGNPPGFGMMNDGRGPGGGRGFGLGDAELTAAAKVLKMTSDELKSALQSGKTLQQLATEKDVKIEDVHAAIQAVHISQMRDRIQQAVKDGKMTQAKADWLLEGLDKGYIGNGPDGFGPGFGGPREGGPGNCPMGQPPALNGQ